MSRYKDSNFFSELNSVLAKLLFLTIDWEKKGCEGERDLEFLEQGFTVLKEQCASKKIKIKEKKTIGREHDRNTELRESK